MPISRIKTDGIQDDAITSAKIGDTNIQSADIADGSVITAKIAAGAVTSAKLDTNIDVAGTLDVTSTTTLDSTLAVAGHGSIGNAGTVDGTRALTVVGATDGTGSSIIVGYNSSLASKFSVRDDGYVNVGNGLNLADGNLSVASGHGIDFSGNANASGMTSELLDAYEEGTWTPDLYNNGVSSTWAVKVGRYTKIGDTVNFWAYFDAGNNGTGGGTLFFTLPFTASGSGSTISTIGNIQTNTAPTNWHPVLASASVSTSQIWSGSSQVNGSSFTFAVLSGTFRVA